jgi:hypothetical protein
MIRRTLRAHTSTICLLALFAFHIQTPQSSLRLEPTPARHAAPASHAGETRYLFLVTADGLRWQELFRGAEPQHCEQGSPFAGENAEARRKALMPFLWSTVVREGQIHGNRDLGSQVQVANRRWFSYPGYHELLCGFADDARVWSNLKIRNRNTTLLEYLEHTEGFEGKVAAFGSWDVFGAILDQKKCGHVVNAGFQPLRDPTFGPHNQCLKTCARPWGKSLRPDSITADFALKYLETRQPRVLYLGLGETDEYGHAGDYPAYLRAAHHFDAQLRRLWETLQAHPVYRGKSTLVVTTDHGRGSQPGQWQHHHAGIPGSNEIWFAVMGPDTPPLGELGEGRYYLQQLTQTCAGFLGVDFRCEHPVAEPVAVAYAPQKGIQPQALASQPLQKVRR